MDLEWNQSTNRYRAESNGIRLSGEIIQIGAVRVNEQMEITEKYCEFIKPEYYKKMNRDVTELTDITNEMIADGRPFREVITEFHFDCQVRKLSPKTIALYDRQQVFL